MMQREKEPQWRGALVFATWDAPTSSYLTSLFGPIFGRLASEYGLKAEVHQATWIEKGSLTQRPRQILADKGIAYRPVIIRKFLGKAGEFAAALTMYFRIRRSFSWRKGPVIIFARAPLAAFVSILAARKVPDAYVVFDADGLPFDERVEYDGADPLGFLYRLMRDIEAYSVRRANAVLVRAEAAVDILISRAGPGVTRSKFRKVVNGRDEKIFAPSEASERAAVRNRLRITLDVPLLCYVGSSFDGKYQGLAILSFFREVRVRLPDARLLLILERPETANRGLLMHPELNDFITVTSATGDEVPALIAASDLGLSLIESGYSTNVVSATKVGEYLLCGLPVVVNRGCGEIAEKLRGQPFADYLFDVEEGSLAKAAEWFVDVIWSDRGSYALQARKFGMDECGLEKSLMDYRGVIDDWRASHACCSG